MRPAARLSRNHILSIMAWIFIAIPAVGLPGFFAYLYAARPHVTDIVAGFIEPHRFFGDTWYFAHSDEAMINGLSGWLLAATLLLIFQLGRIFRRPLKRMLTLPEDRVDGDTHAAE